jgi:VanZ family protein
MQSDFPQPISVLWSVLTVVWAALIFHLSTRTFAPDFSQAVLAGALHLLHLRVSPGTFEFLHASLRKLAHVVEYAIFALFLYGPHGEEALWRPRRAVICILVAATYSLTDEFHQLFVHGRHASLLDCGLDTVGASLAMLVPYTRKQILLRSTTSLPRVNGL